MSDLHAASRRILVVDDEPTVRRFATRVLAEAGYLVEEAPDGAAALDRVHGGPVPLDAVVSDIVMPRLNGVELLRALTRTHPDLPIILMSGYATEQLQGMGIAAPVRDSPEAVLRGSAGRGGAPLPRRHRSARRRGRRRRPLAGARTPAGRG